MPLLAILGGRDVILDMAETRERLSANAPRADIRWLAEAGHFLVGHGADDRRLPGPGAAAMIRELSGRKVYLCADTGPCLAEDRNLSDLIGDLFGSGAEVVAVPLDRLGPDFLRLSSGVAGHLLQKLVNYRFQIAVVGDVSAAVAASDPLRDFIRESNRGKYRLVRGRSRRA